MLRVVGMPRLYQLNYMSAIGSSRMARVTISLYLLFAKNISSFYITLKWRNGEPMIKEINNRGSLLCFDYLPAPMAHYRQHQFRPDSSPVTSSWRGLYVSYLHSARIVREFPHRRQNDRLNHRRWLDAQKSAVTNW